MNVEKVTRKTVVRQVMDQIKALIASGELQPGDKIPTEMALSEQFGTGRSTIREAIKIFEFLGIIESNTRTGTYVCDYTNVSTEALTWSILLGKHELLELVDLRTIIEERALHLIVEKSVNDDEFLRTLIANLEKELEEIESSVRDGTMERLVNADYNFHGTIIDGSGNNVYSHIYATLKSFMHEEIKKTNRKPEALVGIADDHRRIVEAVRIKDIRKAIDVYRHHISTTIQQLN